MSHIEQEYLKILNNCVNLRRKSKLMTVKYIAKRLNISEGQVSNFENGKNINFIRLEKYASFFNIFLHLDSIKENERDFLNSYYKESLK